MELKLIFLVDFPVYLFFAIKPTDDFKKSPLTPSSHSITMSINTISCFLKYTKFSLNIRQNFIITIKVIFLLMNSKYVFMGPNKIILIWGKLVIHRKHDFKEIILHRKTSCFFNITQKLGNIWKILRHSNVKDWKRH